MNKKAAMATLFWKDNCLHLLDQRYLPHRAEYRCCQSSDDVVDAIKEMSVRGAPAIGIAAAYGMAASACRSLSANYNAVNMLKALEEAAARLIEARPTAVNLCWAVRRIERVLLKHQNSAPDKIFEVLLEEANIIHREDIENNRRIGSNGAGLVPPKASVLTHCNAGALATGGYGTALGVVRAAVELGKDIHVFVDETRPLLQGARITAFELIQDDISVTLITDSAAGYLMSTGKIDIIVVGADRIASNGDTANKIGTYALAVLADYHKIPFYVAAPVSTIDMAIESGEQVIIEERCSSEITHLNEQSTAPDGITAFNPAFDITPAKLITAIITERGVIYKPERDRLNKLFST